MSDKCNFCKTPCGESHCPFTEKSNRSRQNTNEEILSILTEYNQKYPDMRFHQILINLGMAEIVKINTTTYCEDIERDIYPLAYYEESDVTLERIKRNIP